MPAVPPTMEESEKYFWGLASQPRLIARTNSATNPWTRPLYRVLGPVADRSLVREWKSAVQSENLNENIIRTLVAREVRWTTFVPLVVHGLPFKDISRNPIEYPGPEPKAENTVFLIIGVVAGSCTWAVGHAVATECHQLLRRQLPDHNIHVLIAEVSVVPLSSLPASPEAPASPASAASAASPVPAAASPTSSNNDHANHALFRAFDSAFDERVLSSQYQSIYKYSAYSEMQAINTAVARFLPFPGQVIRPFFANEESERPAGTLCLYLQLKNKDGLLLDGVYALASRHIVIGSDILQYDRDYLAPASSLSIENPSPQNSKAQGPDDAAMSLTIPVSWGGDLLAAEQHAALRRLSQLVVGRNMQKLFYRGMLDAEGEVHFRFAERCANEYAPVMMDILEREFSYADEDEHQGKGPTGRQFGHVALSGRFDCTKNGFLRDWALVSVHGVKTRAKQDTGTAESTSPPSHPPFFTNHTYIDYYTEDTRVSMSQVGDVEDEAERRSAYFALMDEARDRASFVKLSPPRDTDGALDPQFVFKTGGTTGTTMGVTSPIEAVSRTPYPGKSFANVLSLPVLTMPPPKAEADRNVPITNLKHFSEGGDSGSAIFDQEGTVIAMLDGGVTADRDNAGNKEEPTKPKRSSITTSLGTWPVIDITYATPMAAIFDDIKDITGLDPVMV